MSETMLQKCRRLFHDVEVNIDPNASLLKKIWILVDFLWEKLRYDIELIDYIQYRFYFKKRQERNQFITHGKLIQIIKACNDPESKKYFDRKPDFNAHFCDYLGRDWLDGRNADILEIKAFIVSHPIIFTKYPEGMFGKGIESIRTEDIKDLDAFCKRVKEECLLLEEGLTQHPQFAAFNASSVNSLRVVTLLCADDVVRVMAGVLRLGRNGKIADNFHHEGIAALVDIPTGIVYTVGVDKKGNCYVVHPDSGKQIVGYVIPDWERVKRTVMKAAMIHPEVRYVGWDVTIKADGSIVLIEGNPGADPDITQVEDQIGKWPLYKDFIEEIEQANREAVK